MTSPIIEAKALEAEGAQGHIFGPLDLMLHPNQVCLVRGSKGSGKSALLMALSARFRPTRGTLKICDIDAIREPRKAMKLTGVAQLGSYVVPEDRLTLAESIAERCFLDGVSLAQGERRVAEIEELCGFRIDKAVELEQLSDVERAAASVALVMLRPAKIIVIDGADLLVPHAQQRTLLDLFEKMTHLDDSVIIASTVDTDTASTSAVLVELPDKRPESVRPVSETVPVFQPNLQPPANDATAESLQLDQEH